MSNEQSVDDQEFPGRTTCDRFHLVAKIQTKKFSHRDLQSRNRETQETSEAVVLVPDQSTECDLFFRAWLPPKFSPEKLRELMDKGRSADVYAEIVMETGSPIFGYFRGALVHADHRLDRPHIFVMTKGAQDRLRKLAGKRIQLTVLGCQEEDRLYILNPESVSPIQGMQ